jgi:ectoine hydroxylase-related dioxygenase (phytanoyl-CoA dioxygenase family)
MENGFIGISEALSKSELETIHRDLDKAGVTGLTDKIWHVPSLPPLIENAQIVGALRNIFGDEVRFFKGSFTDSPPETVTAGKSTRTGYHVDYGGGEPEGDFRNSCASWVNVGIYLTGLTRENSPLWVVPGSNRDYGILPCSDLEHMHAQAKVLLAKAGDAIIFHCMTVHAGGHNFSSDSRRALYFSYRPAWARHVGPIPEWPREFVESAPPERKRLLQDLNKGLSMELILRMRHLD